MAEVIINIPNEGQGSIQIPHNELDGLNTGDFQHLTQEEKDSLEVIINNPIVQSVTGDLVDITDPANPIINSIPYFEESFIYSGSQSFELAFTPTNNIDLHINGQFLKPAQ